MATHGLSQSDRHGVVPSHFLVTNIAVQELLMLLKKWCEIESLDGQKISAMIYSLPMTRCAKRLSSCSLGLDSLLTLPSIVVSFAGQTVEDAGPMDLEAPYLFRSYDHHPHVPKEGEARSWVERNPGYSQRIPIWQVARATSAAPTYFDSITIENRKYGDGGFGGFFLVCGFFSRTL